MLGTVAGSRGSKGVDLCIQSPPVAEIARRDCAPGHGSVMVIVPVSWELAAKFWPRAMNPNA